MRTLLPALLVAALLSGCATTHLADPTVAGPAINRHTAGSTVTIQVANRGPVRARALHVAPDTTSWIHPSSGRIERIATTDLLSVERRRRGQGAARGALTAAATAAVVTAVAIQFTDLGECRENAWLQLWCNGDKPAINLAFGLGAGMLAAPIGAVTGAIGGSPETWQMNAAPPLAPSPPAVTARATPSPTAERPLVSPLVRAAVREDSPVGAEWHGSAIDAP